MITEKQLERALDLRKDIQEMRLKLAKIEELKVSKSEIGCSFSIDSNRVEVDQYTIGTLRKFKQDIIKIYTSRLEELKKEYSSIVMTEEEAIEKALFGDDEEF